MKMPKQAAPVLRIPAPVDRATGLGDVVKKVTAAVGVEACGGCERRAAALNRWVTFSPMGKGGGGG